jgi:hypothetical protein
MLNTLGNFQKFMWAGAMGLITATSARADFSFLPVDSPFDHVTGFKAFY